MPQTTGTQTTLVLKAGHPALTVASPIVHLKHVAAHELVHATRTGAVGGTYLDVIPAGAVIGRFVWAAGERWPMARPPRSVSARSR